MRAYIERFLAILEFRLPMMTQQLLGKLPVTVRAVGLELIGSFGLPELNGKKGVNGFPGVSGSRQDAANLVGYIAVVRGYTVCTTVVQQCFLFSIRALLLTR